MWLLRINRAQSGNATASYLQKSLNCFCHGHIMAPRNMAAILLLINWSTDWATCGLGVIVCFLYLEKLENGKHSRKSSVFTLGLSFRPEDSDWSELPIYLLRRDIFKRSCKVSLIWNHAVRRFINFIASDFVYLQNNNTWVALSKQLEATATPYTAKISSSVTVVNEQGSAFWPSHLVIIRYALCLHCMEISSFCLCNIFGEMLIGEFLRDNSGSCCAWAFPHAGYSHIWAT